MNYVLKKSEISIGRDPSNDIVLQDNKVSRHHAVLLISESGISIRNQSDKNKTIVNGQDVEELALVPGSEIQLGNTTLFLQLEVNEVPSPVAAKESVGALKSQSSNSDRNKKIRFYGVVAVVAGALIFILTSEDKKPEEAYNFRSQEAIEEEITETQKRKQDLESQFFSTGKNSAQYLQAEANYQQGSREYREGNYSRAISYFNACLSLYPNHVLARRYLTQARRKLSEEIQYALSMANSLREKARYKEAMSYYRHVMILVNDPNDLSYKEASALYDESLLKIKGAF